MRIIATKTLLAAAIAAAPLTANALSLEDYLVANSSFDEAYVNGSFNATEPERDRDDDRLGYDYTVQANYKKSFSTLPRFWSYNLGLNAGGGRSSSKTSQVPNPLFETDPTAPEELTVNNKTTESWQAVATGTIDNYFHQSSYPKAFWFGKGQFRTIKGQPDDDISGTVGLGYGRVYNATPLAKVIRMVEELNEEGLLTGPIPDSVALETAEIIDRVDEFKSKYGEDEYRPDYYAAIEEALARSGALRDGKLGAMGALTADTVLEDEPISPRKHGWVVRVGTGFQASDLSGLSDNDPKLLAEWEYAKPFGYKGQFINLFTFEPILSDETLTKFSNEMSYTHEVTDMIDWVNTWSLTYSDGENDAGESEKNTNHVLSSKYTFDLGNSLDYFVELALTQNDVEPNSRNADSLAFGDDPEIKFKSGFTYRLK